MDQQALISIALKMTMAFGVVLLTFGASIYLAKRFSGGPSALLKKSKFAAKPMEVLAFQSLGPSRGLYLIRCLDKKILVGATNASIQRICEINDESDEAVAPDLDADNGVEESVSASSSNDGVFGTRLEEKMTEDSEKGMAKKFGRGLKGIARI